LPQFKATAPPLGDISVGTTYIPNLKTIQLEGPDLSIIFKGTTAKSAIEFLLSKTNYGYVWVQDNPTFNPKEDVQDNSFNYSDQFSSEDSEEDSVSDSPRYITMKVKDKPFSVVFNSILMSSGLEAKLENGIVYVGPDVQERIFSSRISRIYRLNQTTASAAASYLANLGAKVKQTNTITTAVTQGASQSQSVSGGASSATTTEQSTTSVRSYGGNEGPLLGLIATTDDRLQTITLIGEPDLINVAETYIKQLDLRQRQVALTVRILDVEISDGLNIDNSWAFRQNNKFIVNASGQLLNTINDTTPPAALNFPSAPTANNSNQFTNQQFINLLKADILSKDTKIIANPTLILNEFPGSTGGETVSLGSIDDTLKAGTIGNVRIIDPAVVPLGRVAPKPKVAILVGFLLGVLVAGAIILARVAMRRGISDPAELETHTGFSVFGVIPYSAWLTRKIRGQSREKAMPILARDHPSDVVVEALRSLRTSLEFTQMERESNVVMVTGPAPGVGKSFLSLNLGYLQADTGRKVLVIDADMRRGHLHNAFAGDSRGVGLSDILAGGANMTEAARQIGESSLHMITSGAIPPNPAELLTRPGFAELVKQARAEYDLVIVDAPPILAVTDAGIIANAVERLISLVILKSGAHPWKEIDEAVARFERQGGAVTGLVLNRYRPDQEQAYYGYGHYQYAYDSSSR